MTTATPNTPPAQSMTPDEIRAAVASIPQWWHQIDLGHGIITPGSDQSAAKLARLGFPDDFRGRSVMDVGCWNGFFSFEAEKRNAGRVLATDSHAWRGPGRDGFEIARRALNSSVKDQFIDVMDLSPEAVGVHDVVLFLGVLYHLRHPLLALERVASVTGQWLILETHTDMHFMGRPAMAFYPGDELNHDASNWCGPNPQAVCAMLKAVGFTRTKIISTEPLLRRAGRFARHALIERKNPLPALRQGRLVVHAWK